MSVILAAEQQDSVLGKRTSCDLDERLRHARAHGQEACRQAAGQNRDRRLIRTAPSCPRSRREADLFKAGACHRFPQPAVLLAVEEQKASTPGAHQLASDGSIPQSELVPFVDLRIAHRTGSALLVFPVLVHQLAEHVGVAFLEGFAASKSELLHVVQVSQHLRIGLFRSHLLFLQYAARAARKPGEEQQQVVLEREERLHAELQGFGVDRIIGVEGETGDAAVRRDVLVLLSNGLLQPVDLDFARQFSQIARMQQPPAVRVQRLQQRGRETARGSKAGPGWDIRERRDLYLRRPEAQHVKRLADDRVLDLRDPVDVFQFRVLQKNALDERAHHGHIDVLVDGRRDEIAAMLPVVGRQIGAPASERDS